MRITSIPTATHNDNNSAACIMNSSMDAAKYAMLGAKSPMVVPSSAQQLQTPSLKAAAPLTPTTLSPTTAINRELLQHYAYLRYGDAKNRDSSGRKQHICPVKTCGRRFSTPGNLSRHKRLHGPVKPLKCPVDGCICAFRSENKLEKHMKFHLGIPVHVCSVPACGKTFSTAGNLNRHIKGHHASTDVPATRRAASNSISSNGGGSVYSASSSGDEYDSSGGGDDEFVPSVSGDQLDALVAMLDQDIDDHAVDPLRASLPAAAASPTGALTFETESMLALLLQDDSDAASPAAAQSPKRKHSLLDDIIRFHISHIGADNSGNDA